ncbi:hypothetical protein D3C75_556510 [compost metagenome]
MLHYLVGCGFDTSGAGSQEKLHIITVVLLSKVFDLRNDPLQSGSSMVSQVDVQREQVAVFVKQSPRCLSDDRVEHALVGYDLCPLKAALVEGRTQLLRQISKRVAEYHTWLLLQSLLQRTHFHQSRVVSALVCWCGNHHRHQVATGRVMLGQVVIVTIVGRVRA